MTSIGRSKVASMIYNIYQNNGRGLSFLEGIPNGISFKSCSECIKERFENLLYA